STDSSFSSKFPFGLAFGLFGEETFCPLQLVDLLLISLDHGGVGGAEDPREQHVYLFFGLFDLTLSRVDNLLGLSLPRAPCMLDRRR
ncbi:MAG: hypothetical protein AAGC81_19970, partial [Pseudomonadota bacterium]